MFATLASCELEKNFAADDFHRVASDANVNYPVIAPRSPHENPARSPHLNPCSISTRSSDLATP